MKKSISLIAIGILAANSLFAQNPTLPSEPKLKSFAIDTIYTDDPNSPGNMIMKTIKELEKKYLENLKVHILCVNMV